MRAHRGTPHFAVGETMNLMMFCRELQLPEQLQGYLPPAPTEFSHEYVVRTKERLEQAHGELQQKQLAIRQEDREELPLFAVKDMVQLGNTRLKKRINPKL